MCNYLPRRGRPARLLSPELRAKTLYVRMLRNRGFSDAEIAVRMGFRVQDEDTSSCAALSVHRRKRDTIRTVASTAQPTRLGSRSVRNYLHDAKLALPQFVSEAAGELARLKRDLKTALALYNHVCRAGLPGGDDLLAAIRPVFERYQQLGELALAVAGTPPASAYPMMNELLDAISVDDLYYSAVRDLDP